MFDNGRGFPPSVLFQAFFLQAFFLQAFFLKIETIVATATARLKTR